MTQRVIDKLSLALGMAALSVFSGSLLAQPSWGPKENINSIEVGSGAAYFASPSYTSCGSVLGQAKLDLTSTNAKEIYAAVLAAYTSGKPVELYTDGCTGLYYIVRAARY